MIARINFYRDNEESPLGYTANVNVDENGMVDAAAARDAAWQMCLHHGGNEIVACRADTGEKIVRVGYEYFDDAD
jgi:hypothetical protein